MKKLILLVLLPWIWNPVVFAAGRKTQADSNSMIFVDVNEFAITRGIDRFPTLKTVAIDNCIVLTLYDREDRIGGMAHFTVMQTDAQIAETIIESRMYKLTSFLALPVRTENSAFFILGMPTVLF